MTPWEEGIRFVFAAEGGYTLDPVDPGGETNFGISKKAYPSMDIKAMTPELARTIYLHDYWQACQCDQLPREFAIMVFDTAVNQGHTVAQRILQMVLAVEVDGRIGPQTVAAAFKVMAGEDARRTVIMYLAERNAAYARLMAAKPPLFKFATNWFHRVLSLADLVFKEPAIC